MLIPLANIVTNPDHNPRKGDLEGITALAASLKANGLLQPILVRLLPHPPETYEVVAGHRRLAAALLLGWERIDTIVCTAENAHELALTENVMRQAMHPVDEYAAFAKLLSEGLKPKQIAKRFGLTERAVKQRLALGSMAPEVRAFWRQGSMSDRAAQLLCQATPAQQIAILEEAEAKGFERIEDYMVRRYFNTARVNPDNHRMKFVGLDAFKKAGGKIERDLFGDNEWIADTELLDTLYDEKLHALTEEIMAAGWKDVWSDDDDDGPSYKTHDQVRVTEALEPEERSLIEVTIDIRWDGQPVLAYYREKQNQPEAETKPVEKAGASMMAEPDLSKSLSEDMSRVMTGFAHVYAGQNSNRQTVLAMLAYTLLRPALSLPLRIKAELYPGTPQDKELLAQRTLLDSTGTVEWLMGLETDDLINIIHIAASRTLDFTDGYETGTPAIRKQWYTLLNANSQAAPVWKPTAENYFKRLNKEQIIAAMKKMKPAQGGDFGTAGGLTKKGELALIAERWAAETGWLPELLAPRLYDDHEEPPGGGSVVKEHVTQLLQQAAE